MDNGGVTIILYFLVGWMIGTTAAFVLGMML